MSAIVQRFSIPFTYAVHFTEGVFRPGNDLLAGLFPPAHEGPARVLAVFDAGLVQAHPHLPEALEHYADHHAGAFRLVAPPMQVPGGEAAKNDPALLTRIHEAIYRHGIDRHAYVLAAGGGAVLDLVGFAAATAHRGVRLLRVPSTVLAQNDSGVGVKNGVNAFGSKNFLGSFAPPFAVINDRALLDTLDDRDWTGGMAEAVKVALIKDPAFFHRLEADAGRLAPPVRDAEAMARLIRRCAELHLEHIATSGDPFERGSSRPLDFGHWAAHRLEHLTGYTLRHGEAVAVGLALDCTYAALAGLLPEPVWDRILSLLERLGLPCYVPELEAHLDDPAHPAGLFRGLREFQEHLGGPLTILLLRDIGAPVEVHEVRFEGYRQAVERLRARAAVSAS
ncbi:3-dehydroquinate synthase [Rhodothermaceae bacterium RA]|nr:3-dehydroquinate synthase [Rhodothermaceae bacterium RA]